MNVTTYRKAAACVLLATGLLVACKRPSKAGAGGSFVPVKTMNLPSQVIATGTVTPRVGAEIKVGPRVSGQLQQLNVKIGDTVKKGQVLAVLEERDLQANVDKAEAQLRAAQAAQTYTTANYERLATLLPKGYVSKDGVDAALQARDAAVSNVKSAQAAVDYSRIQLSYATITAPIDGVVESVATNEGETVAASFNAPTFVTLIDLTRLEVDAYVDEVDIGGVKVGQKATFTVDAYPSKTFHGTVEAIHPQAVIQDNVVNYDVIIGIDDPFEGILRPTMTANVTITLNTLANVLAIPLRAVKRESGKAFVMVPNGKTMVQRPVTLGRESGDFVQIKAGLSEGDKIFVPGGNQGSEQGM